MARAIWSGAISFGLVNVPVKLFSATEDKSVHFRQFQEGTGERIRYKRVAEGTGEEVAYEDIVKGYEIERGRYVIVTPDELEAVEPGRTRSIDIEDFVDLDEIDPIYYDTTYYLAPAEGAGAERPYALLRSAMAEANKVAIARFVMRTKQYLAAIRPSEELLVLETMHFPDEVRAPDVVDNGPDGVEVPERERRAALQLIDSLSSTWEPDKYHDTYRERVLDLVHRKAEGEEIVTERPAPEEGKVVDLMAALEASVRNARSGRPAQAPADEAPLNEDRGDGRGDRGQRWSDMSKGDLYDEAQRRQIPGRSKMSKDELVQALQVAS